MFACMQGVTGLSTGMIPGLGPSCVIFSTLIFEQASPTRINKYRQKINEYLHICPHLSIFIYSIQPWMIHQQL